MNLLFSLDKYKMQEILPSEKCRLEVKLSNNSFDKLGGTDSPLFVTKSILDGLFKKTQIMNEIETSKTFVIAEMLHKGEMRNFSISMRYPLNT